MGGAGLAARAGVGAVVMKQVQRRGQGPGQGRGRAGKGRTLLNGNPQEFQSHTALSSLEVSLTLVAVGGESLSSPCLLGTGSLGMWGADGVVLSIQDLPGLSLAQVFSQVSYGCWNPEMANVTLVSITRYFYQVT